MAKKKKKEKKAAAAADGAPERADEQAGTEEAGEEAGVDSPATAVTDGTDSSAAPPADIADTAVEPVDSAAAPLQQLQDAPEDLPGPVAPSDAAGDPAGAGAPACADGSAGADCAAIAAEPPSVENLVLDDRSHDAAPPDVPLDLGEDAAAASEAPAGAPVADLVATEGDHQPTDPLQSSETGAVSTETDASEAQKVEKEAAAAEKKSPSAGRTPETPPVDIKELTIRNLDTGEEYVIGENDPDFEFDTFELDGGNEAEGDAAGEEAAADSTEDWFDKLYNWIFNKPSKSAASKSSPEGKADGSGRTPYTKLSSFKFRRELGKGAFGRVLLAESKIDGKLYAMKIISKANMRSSDKRQAKAERDILHAMSHQNPHPFTTGLKFAFQSVNNLYIGMEYLPGGNLRQLIQKFGTLPEHWVQFYSAELVLAISHLHALHVIYRDIKPHNVMIDAKGHLILIDYGLSKQEVSHPRGAQSLVGTPDYSAPEVLKTGVYRIENAEREKKGKKKKSPPPDGSSMGYGKAADWWSVGVMIYEMLAGTPPFRGPDLRQTYQNVLFADLKFTPTDKFSEPAMVLLRGMIQRDPSLRLGAWSNPPTDIMESEFFAGVEWDSLMEKRVDGPWIPPEEPLVAARRKKDLAAAAEQKRIEEEEENLEGWEEDCNEAAPLGVAPKVTRVNPRQPKPVTEASAMDKSELLNIRESIFDASGVANANKIPDWSFVDSSALPPSDSGKKKTTGTSKKNLNKL